MKRSTRAFIKWLVYILVLFVLFILQTTPGFLKFFGAQPNLLIPYVVSLSMLENEKMAAAMGALAGGFWDSHTTKLFGFSSIILMLCCVAIALLVMYLIKSNIVNAVLFCAAVLIIYYILEYLFQYLIWNYENVWILLVRHTLPGIGMTLLICPAIFIVIRKLHYKLQEKTELQ